MFHNSIMYIVTKQGNVKLHQSLLPSELQCLYKWEQVHAAP